MEYAHTSVLANELLENLKPFGKNPIMLDCTLGEGGHSHLFLQNYDSLKVIGLDRDPIILERAKLRLEPYKERFTAVNTWFDDYLNSYDGNDFTLILFDLGISMFHYQESQRGFSFSKNELLDMRL